jgi:hypothetical protein
MKPAHAALLKEIDALAVKLGHKQRTWLQVIVNEGDDPKPAQEKALGEWQAAHPKVKARAIDDFDWLVWSVVRWTPQPGTRLPGPSSSTTFDTFAEDTAVRRRFARRIVYSKVGAV